MRAGGKRVFPWQHRARLQEELPPQDGRQEVGIVCCQQLLHGSVRQPLLSRETEETRDEEGGAAEPFGARLVGTPRQAPGFEVGTFVGEPLQRALQGEVSEEIGGADSPRTLHRQTVERERGEPRADHAGDVVAGAFTAAGEALHAPGCRTQGPHERRQGIGERAEAPPAPRATATTRQRLS